MPRPPAVSPVTGSPVPEHYIHSSSLHFQDTHGRSLLLRGVNLSGGAKAPHGQPSWSAKGFWEDAEAGKGDFAGRPLNLEDGSADVHLARLRAWGYNFIRYVFTWEALEHEGPGKYDREFMDYVVKVLWKCKEWGFKVFMDPHQDVWSRFSGGSGAPLWTLYACGIDPMNISPTFGSLLHHEWPSREAPRPQDFPLMIWATNYTRLVNQTVWTLFFAGKTFAPKCIIDDKNIQDWLQDHFIDAVGALAKRIAEEDGLYDEVVLGWDSMNEPGDGMIGKQDIGIIPKDQRLKKGPSPTAFEGMKLGMGEAVDAEDWEFTAMGPKYKGKVNLDPKGVKLWLAPEDEVSRGGGKWGWNRSSEWKLGTCIWAQHGVWDASTSQLLKPAYFRMTAQDDPSSAIAVPGDFWRTHWMSYASRIRLEHPEAIHFVNNFVMEIPPHLPESFIKGRLCTSPHYYDGLTLMTKHWNWFNADAVGLLRHRYWSVVQAIKIGEPAIRKSMQDQLGIFKNDTKAVYGDYPTLIGEIGCPYDMDEKKAYGYVDGGKGEGDYSSQQKAWDSSLNATDGPNCLNYTLWTYVPDNSHEWGDLWNNEDLSIFSEDDARKSEIARVEDDHTRTTTTVKPVSSSPNLSNPPSTAASSSATLTASSPSKNFSPSGIASGESVTRSLILDGSRAAGAVVRPYPLATVGTPLRIDFDIASSAFKYSVSVSPEDAVDGELATEIYLPFVHYAESLDQSLPLSSKNPSKVSLLKDASPAQSRSQTPTLTTSLRLDVDVNVSHGDYTIKGQYLYWTYPVPSSGTQTYTIEVKRKGGAIVRDLGWVQSGSWGDVVGMMKRLGVDALG